MHTCIGVNPKEIEYKNVDWKVGVYRTARGHIPGDCNFYVSFSYTVGQAVE
jgi:hypothetical protein